MVEKLHLPFPLLSDPDGTGAIKPYDVWDQERAVARPAVVIVDTAGEQVYRQVSRDFADRLTEDDVVAEVRTLQLPPVIQDPPSPGEPQPSERAMPVAALGPYYRGAKFAATAVGMRVAEAAREADALAEEVARYAEAVKTLTSGGASER